MRRAVPFAQCLRHNRCDGEARARGAALRPSVWSDASLDLLLTFDALEECAKVAPAEAVIALALQELDEERPRLRVVEERRGLFHEDLEHVLAVALSVDEHLELLQPVQLLFDAVDAELEQTFRSIS